jgi:hypothetical protein
MEDKQGPVFVFPDPCPKDLGDGFIAVLNGHIGVLNAGCGFTGFIEFVELLGFIEFVELLGFIGLLGSLDCRLMPSSPETS